MRHQPPSPSRLSDITEPGLPLRRRAALGVAATFLLPLLPALTACASERPIGGHPVTMSIVDRETGQTLTSFRHQGRTYVAGRPAARYAVRLANRSAGRVLVVLSVDGVNAISGETAAASQTGYVLDPGQSGDITGWRKSDTAVAAFVFAALTDSYAARTGRPGNVGVIGAAVFLERAVPVAMVPSEARRDARAESAKADAGARSAAEPTARAAAPAAAAASPLDAAPAGAQRALPPTPAPMIARSERLGTGHGEREWSVSRRTVFERQSRSPQDLLEIAYDSFENLVLAGVIAAPTAQARAFPGDDGRGFVADPPPLR